MSVTITGTEMTSTRTRLTAQFHPNASADGRGAWVVSWLPLRLLDRDQAVTAMTLAKTAADGLPPGDWRWVAIESWARELGLTGAEAVARVTRAAR